MDIVEGKFGTGAQEQPQDLRDIPFSSATPFDWELGFDIELLLGFRKICKDENEFFGPAGREGWGVKRYKEIVEIVKEEKIPPFVIPIKNQGGSSSCTGQADSYYLSVLNMIETGEWVEISARDVYAYTSLGYGKGGYLRDALKLSVNRGIGTEDLVPCYHVINRNGKIIKQPYTEKEYLVKPEETPELKAVRKMLQSKEYRSIGGAGEYLMESMAWAMLMGFGVFFGVRGQNGRGWLTEYPQPPISPTWKHALFGGKAKLINGKKTIGFVNSWGDKVGLNGWQKLKKNYYTSLNVFDAWTLIDKENKHMLSNVKIIKDKNSPSVGIWLPALSPEALKSYCLNFGIEIPKKDNGEIDWDQWIDGELEIKKK